MGGASVRQVYQVASLVFIAGGIYVVLEARSLTLYTIVGPGPGFFPFWLGILFIGLSIGWLCQVSLQREEPMEKDFIPRGAGVVRLISITAALVLFSLLVDVIGFQLVMLCFMFFLLIVLGRQNLVLTVIVSAAGSFGLFYVFKAWLGVPLPESSLEFLRNLGL
jgi:putative tricarboxylic transport membrane protein